MVINHTTYSSNNPEVLNPEMVMFLIQGVKAFYRADPFMQKNWHKDDKFEANVTEHGRIEAWVLKEGQPNTTVFVAMPNNGDYHIMIYKPGKWVTHLQEIYKKFQQKYSEKIDDSDVFN